MKTLIHERVEMAQAGTNPTVLCRMPSGWAVLGDAQFMPGYCLLLPDPVVPDLNASEPEEYLRGPVFSSPREQRARRPFDAERDRDLMRRLADAIRSKQS